MSSSLLSYSNISSSFVLLPFVCLPLFSLSLSLSVFLSLSLSLSLCLSLCLNRSVFLSLSFLSLSISNYFFLYYVPVLCLLSNFFLLTLCAHQNQFISNCLLLFLLFPYLSVLLIHYSSCIFLCVGRHDPFSISMILSRYSEVGINVHNN